MLAATAQAGPEADAWIGDGDVQLWGAATTGVGRARLAPATSGSPGHETAAPVAAAPAVDRARRRGRPGGRLLRRRRWYFAGQIQSGALAVEPGTALPAYTDARVVAVPPGLVRLRAIGSQPALFKPELNGIAWRGGIGHLGASVAVSGGVVTRPLTVVSGSPPRAGQLAGLDTSYFLGDPAAALGIPVRDVAVPGPLGPLPAWYFPGPESTFIIGVHGQNGTRRDALRVIDIVHRMGFPALAITYRNDLGAARDPSGYLRSGQTEWSD